MQKMAIATDEKLVSGQLLPKNAKLKLAECHSCRKVVPLEVFLRINDII